MKRMPDRDPLQLLVEDAERKLWRSPEPQIFGYLHAEVTAQGLRHSDQFLHVIATAISKGQHGQARQHRITLRRPAPPPGATGL